VSLVAGLHAAGDTPTDEGQAGREGQEDKIGVTVGSGLAAAVGLLDSATRW
jgi:hypothetical protein